MGRPRRGETQRQQTGGETVTVLPVLSFVVVIMFTVSSVPSLGLSHVCLLVHHRLAFLKRIDQIPVSVDRLALHRLEMAQAAAVFALLQLGPLNDEGLELAVLAFLHYLAFRGTCKSAPTSSLSFFTCFSWFDFHVTL